MEYFAQILANNSPTMVMLAVGYWRLSERNHELTEMIIEIQTILKLRRKSRD